MKNMLVLVMLLLSAGVFGQKSEPVAGNKLGGRVSGNIDTKNEGWINCRNCPDCPSAAVYINGKFGGDLNKLDAADVESFSVLKDTVVINDVVYHGVVVVTTKTKTKFDNISTPSPINSESNTDQIIGVWRFSSSASGIIPLEIKKIITKGHFVCIHTLDNVITTSFGGTCTFDGENYIENITFGTQNRNDIGKTGTLKIRFEGKKMYLTGLVSGPNRASFSEVWERVE